LILAKKLVLWGEVEAEKAMDGTWQIAEEEVSKTKELFQFSKYVRYRKILFKSYFTGWLYLRYSNN
jgi:hypothetical protein